MLSGEFRGRQVGSGTDTWRAFEAHRVGATTDDELDELEGCVSRSAGHCMTMGTTASTMASLTEALGLQLAGSAAVPAVDLRRLRIVEAAGRRIVEMARTGGPRPSEILTPAAFRNAIRVNAAIGGSINAIVHLLAIAHRLGVPLELEDFNAYAEAVPLLADPQPSGSRLMDSFANAGGVPAVSAQLADVIETDVESVNQTSSANRIITADRRVSALGPARRGHHASHGLGIGPTVGPLGRNHRRQRSSIARRNPVGEPHCVISNCNRPGLLTPEIS